MEGNIYGSEYLCNTKIRFRISQPVEFKYGPRIKELRKLKGLRQEDLAQACRVSQTTIVRWEKDVDRPPGQALMTLGRLAGEPDRWWWWERAGVGPIEAEQIMLSYPTIGGKRVRDAAVVPLLKDAAAAGTPRAIDENEIEGQLVLPVQWVPRSSSITAVRVEGDSMSPILEPGYIVLVDTSQRDPKKLINQMVAARADDGVTIKWLRKEGQRKSVEEMYILLPNHTSLRHPVRVITAGSDSVSIVGKVVKWIGEPPSPRK